MRPKGRFARKALVAATGLTACLMLAALDAPLQISDIAGVYKQHFLSRSQDGAYQSENTLDVVSVDDTHAYLSVHLEFDYGHQCNIAGVATLAGERLVYAPHLDPDQYACTLALNREGDRLVFHDIESGCLITFCGMRGRFEGASFPLSARRRIRYMSRLRGSREYLGALREAGLR